MILEIARVHWEHLASVAKLPVRFLLALRFLELFTIIPRRKIWCFSLTETKIAQVFIIRSNLEPSKLAVVPLGPFLVCMPYCKGPKQRSMDTIHVSLVTCYISLLNSYLPALPLRLKRKI